MAGIQIPIEMLFKYLKDGGFTKFECTPGGGFKAGVGVAIFYPPSKDAATSRILRTKCVGFFKTC